MRAASRENSQVPSVMSARLKSIEVVAQAGRMRKQTMSRDENEAKWPMSSPRDTHRLVFAPRRFRVRPRAVRPGLSGVRCALYSGRGSGLKV